MLIPGSIPEIGDRLTAQLRDALLKALDVLQIPTCDELATIKEKVADISEIVDELDKRCSDLIAAGEEAGE